MPGAFACDMRLIAQPLIGDDAHGHGSLADCDLLRPYTDPHARRRRKRLLRRLIEAVAVDVKGYVGTNRETETTIGPPHLRLQQIHRRLADEARDEQIGRTVLQLPLACELLEYPV